MVVRPNLILFAAALILGACSPLPADLAPPIPSTLASPSGAQPSSTAPPQSSRPFPVDSPSSSNGQTTLAPSAESVPRYDLLELSFKHDGSYENKFLDVMLGVVFTSPRGEQHRVDGFYYDGDLWKVRFRPDEPGEWKYTYVMTDKGGFRQLGNGTFACTPAASEGLVRSDPNNDYRWVFSDGTPYFPLGLQDCIGAQGNQLGVEAIDGEMRDNPHARQISLEEYFSIYAQAGFNLFRFSQRNCSYSLFDDLDHYRPTEIMATDELLRLARKYGFRVMFGFFGSYNQAIATNPDVIAKQEAFIDYCVARWGVYVDFWELLNESGASQQWATRMADYVRSVDTDLKPISISNPMPNLPAIDIDSPHWYESENDLQSDLRVQQLATNWKHAGKPVIVGEQGNSGMNWDPRSGLRMRIRTWTALFQEITLIFWNTSWAKNGVFHGNYTPGGAANIYLGPEERGYARVLSDFSSRLDAGVRISPVEVSAPMGVRAYGLASTNVAAVYLHHFENHDTAVNDLKITLDLPNGVGSSPPLLVAWIDPSSGTVLERISTQGGRQTLAVPSFAVDLSLLVTPVQPAGR